ncbi:tetratricopeptide repeat protein [Aquimarina rhabdastrellae]
MTTTSRYLYCILLISFLGNLPSSNAQEIEPKQEINVDDLGDVSDEFQEQFFEALKQKGIQNYEKAIEALEKCIAIDNKPQYLYYELAKNQLALKQYEEAESNFKKVLEQYPKKRYVLTGLYEVYYQLRKYDEAINVVERLVPFDGIYREQLANLYLIVQKNEKALKTLDELEEEFGTDNYRKRLRRTILARSQNSDAQITYLKEKIEAQPNEEQHYLNLIYVYSGKNKITEAREVAENLLKVKPESELVHLALYKFYLDENKIEKAIESIEKVIHSDIDIQSKNKVIDDFLIFVDKNPTYERSFLKVVTKYAKEANSSKIFTKLGNFYYQKNEKELALNYYERDIASHTDFESLKRIILLQIDLGRYKKAKDGIELGLELYPTQPILYLVHGVALNQLKDPEAAIETLNLGIDYIIDDTKMEGDFYKQIGEAYLLIGDQVKSTKYLEKAKALQQKI